MGQEAIFGLFIYLFIYIYILLYIYVYLDIIYLYIVVLFDNLEGRNDFFIAILSMFISWN